MHLVRRAIPTGASSASWPTSGAPAPRRRSSSWRSTRIRMTGLRASLTGGCVPASSRRCCKARPKWAPAATRRPTGPIASRTRRGPGGPRRPGPRPALPLPAARSALELRHARQPRLPLRLDPGFADQPGFRAGIAQPLPPLGPRGDRPLRLVEIPLAAMDVTLAEERYRTSRRAMRQPPRRARRLGGGTAAVSPSSGTRSNGTRRRTRAGTGCIAGSWSTSVPVVGSAFLRASSRRRRTRGCRERRRVYRAGLGRAGGSLVFLGLLATAPALLLLARLFPPESVALPAARCDRARAAAAGGDPRARVRPAHCAQRLGRGRLRLEPRAPLRGLALTLRSTARSRRRSSPSARRPGSRSSPPSCVHLFPSRAPMRGPGSLWSPWVRSSGPRSGGRRARSTGMRSST